MSEPTLLVWAPLGVEAMALRAGLRGSGVRVERCGMGPARARAAVRRHDPGSARALAVAGVCGALDPELRPGTVVVPGDVSTRDGATHRADAAGLVDALRRRGIAARTGALVGSDHLVTGAERSRLFEVTGAAVVDMETPWLAAAAAERPFAVLRVVVDAPRHELRNPAALARGFQALGVLRQAAPALDDWARARTAHSENRSSAPVGSAPETRTGPHPR